MDEKEPNGWLTLAQIGRQYGVPRATLTLAIRSGALPAWRVDNRYYVRGDNLAGWLETWKPRKP